MVLAAVVKSSRQMQRRHAAEQRDTEVRARS